MKHGTGILRMELGADEPTVAGDFDDLDQVALGIRSDTFHAILFVFFFILVIELVSVAMAFTDLERAVDFSYAAAFAKRAVVSTQTHGAA